MNPKYLIRFSITAKNINVGKSIYCNEPSGTSTDRLGVLGVDPRTDTYFALDPLSGRTLIVGVLW